MTRVYLPATRAGLAALVAGGGLPADEAVTAPGDDEESEYAALMTAADRSAELARSAGEGNRRVVLVGELAQASTSLARGDLVAVHLDVADRGDAADPDEDLAWFAPEELEHLL